METLAAMGEIAYELRWWIAAVVAAVLAYFAMETPQATTGTAFDLEPMRESAASSGYDMGYADGWRKGAEAYYQRSEAAYTAGFEHGREYEQNLRTRIYQEKFANDEKGVA